MKRNGITGLVSILALLFAATLPAESVVELFQKAKQQVKVASYDEALKTLADLDTESAKPGHENERHQIEPPLAFYRGVCEAALGHKDRARTEFQKYLVLVPAASIDASMYPKKAVAAFEDARRTMPTGAEETPSEMASFAQSYAKFQLTSPPPPETPNEEWGNGPVRYLMTSEERREWPRLSDAVSRSEFMTKFWAARDPKPETPNNEGKEEFQRRVAFADANFKQDETRGSMTDRGMVFVLCGPPTYVGRKPIRGGEDASEAAGMSTSGRNDVNAALGAASAGGAKTTTSGGQAAIADRMTGPGTRILDSAANWREVWHYRREVLPSGVPYQQVDFEFITRSGYGKNVLQRDSSVLATLDAAKKTVTAASR